VRLKATGQWVLVQDQDKQGIAGGHFVNDFKNNAGTPLNVTKNADGTHSFAMPSTDYNDHFWFGSRGTFGANTVDAVYTQYDMRIDDPKAKVVASVGADWWLNANAPYLQDHSTNPGVGSGNWVDLTTEWKTIGYYSLPTEQLANNLPPGLAGSSSQNPTPAPTAPVKTPAPSSQLDKITVKAQADVYLGGANFALLIDGKLVDKDNVVTATKSSGAWQTFDFTGDFDASGTQNHKVEIVFDNDRFGGVGNDKNLFIDAVTFNGVTNGQDWSYAVNGSHAWDFNL